MSESTGIDKDTLYGDFRAGEQDRRKLAMRAAHKALDMADDDMKIEANKTVNGVGAKTLVGAILAAGLPAAALAGLLMTKQAPAPAAPPQPAVTAPAATSVNPLAAVPAKEGEEDVIVEELQTDGKTWKEIRRTRKKVGDKLEVGP